MRSIAKVVAALAYQREGRHHEMSVKGAPLHREWHTLAIPLAT